MLLQLNKFYHNSIPDFILELSQTPPMQRLRDVGMNCGCEYTGFSVFQCCEPYHRYEHSLGVALIVWHFTGSRTQAVSGLFHDIATPAFAHTVDFMNGDYVTQESTEEGTEQIIRNSPEIVALLERYGLCVEEVSDYHCYPIADNDTPRLSADRLEYTLANAVNYGFAAADEVRALYQDLTVTENEEHQPELAFCTAECGLGFAALALKNAHIYTADEDRYSMQRLAEVLRLAVNHGVLTLPDLYRTETEVIQTLLSHEETASVWKQFRSMEKLLRAEAPTDDGRWVRVDAKKRYIDPLIVGKGRASDVSEELREQITAYQKESFSLWLKADESAQIELR